MTTSPVGFDKTGEQVLYLVDSREPRHRRPGRPRPQDRQGNRPRPGPACRRGHRSPSDRTDYSCCLLHVRPRPLGIQGPRPSRPTSRSAQGGRRRDHGLTSRTLDDKTWIVAFLMDNGPVRTTFTTDAPGRPVPVLQPQGTGRTAIAKDAPSGHSSSRDVWHLVCYLTYP